MAIINCPSCNQKISDKAKVCSNCNYDFVTKSTAQGLDQEQLAAKQKMDSIKRKYSLQMQAMLAIIAILAGSLIWYFGGREGSSVLTIVSYLLLAVGSILYLTTRVRLIIYKKSK
jgi:uncharacterized membrane protein YvbJ